MKVVVVNGSFTRGHGMDTAIATTLSRIHKIGEGIDFEVLCCEAEGLTEDGFPKDIPVHVYQRRKFFGYRSASSLFLMSKIMDDGGAVIHSHHPITSLPLLLKKGKKVFTWHGNNNVCWNDVGFGPFPKRIARKMMLDISTYMSRTLDKIVTISDYLRNELVHGYAIPSKKVERIYWGVDLNRFNDSQEDEGYMLFVGRHVRYKGIKHLVKLAEFFNYPLVCVGDGVERDWLEHYSRSFNAPVEFKGKVPLHELIDLYRKCSFYITASRWEGFGLPIVEAGACGKPVIAPKNTAHPELIVDKKTGFLYQDIEELMKSTKILINEPKRRREMGEGGREHVSQKFSLDNAARAYLHLYQALS